MRLIDGDKLMETIRNNDYPLKSHFNSTDNGMFTIGIQLAVDAQPTVDAVPLDKLCEWLANSFSDPPCCTLENVRCKMECRGFTQIDHSECWRHVLTKWMEGLDVAMIKEDEHDDPNAGDERKKS